MKNVNMFFKGTKIFAHLSIFKLRKTKSFFFHLKLDVLNYLGKEVYQVYVLTIT
jgi:hypothetical protein